MAKFRIWSVALLTCVLLLSGPSHAVGVKSASGIPNLDIILVIDESGSMWQWSDPPGADYYTNPEQGFPGWRVVAADLFADMLGVDQSGASHTLSIILFGTDAQQVAPLTPMSSQSERDAFKAALRTRHENMGWTDILEALQLARQELSRNGRHDAFPAVIFLSDGQYAIHEGMTDEEVAEANSAIRELVENEFVGQCPIYTIALTEEAYRDTPDSLIYDNLWQEIANRTGGLYFEPEHAEGELLGVYIQIIRHLFGLASESAPSPVMSPTEEVIEISSSLAQVIFTIAKANSAVEVDLLRPNGDVVHPEDRDVEYSSSSYAESYSIQRPEPGLWTVRLSGVGEVIVFTIPFPVVNYRIHVAQPGNLHPLGKPMQIAVRVADPEGRIITPQAISLQVQSPSGETQSVQLEVAEDNVYKGLYEDTMQRGSYQLRFRAEVEGTVVEDEWFVQVVPGPWIAPTLPSPNQVYPRNQPLPVQGQLMFGLEPLTAPDPRDEYVLQVEMYGPRGRMVEARELEMGLNGAFSSALQPLDEGRHRIVYHLIASYPSGEIFEDVSDVDVTVQGELIFTPTFIPPTIVPTSTPTVTPTPRPGSTAAIIGIVGGLLFIVVLAAAGLWYFSQPSLVGTLELNHTPYRLSGRRARYLGSAPGSVVPLTGEGILPKHAILRPIGSSKSPRVEIRSADPNMPIRINGLETTFSCLQNEDTIEIGNQMLVYTGPIAWEPFGPDFGSVENPSTNEWNF